MASAFDYVNQSGAFYGSFINGSTPSGGYNTVLGSLWNGLNNVVTGDMDYHRNLETLGFQNAFNSSEAQKQRDYEERLSNTAYQRAVSDMKAAGLNPALASAHAAATPSGATAHSASGSSIRADGFRSILGLVGSIITSAFGMARQSTMDAAALEREQLRADTAFRLSQSRLSSGFNLTQSDWNSLSESERSSYWNRFPSKRDLMRDWQISLALSNRS